MQKTKKYIHVKVKNPQTNVITKKLIECTTDNFFKYYQLKKYENDIFSFLKKFFPEIHDSLEDFQKEILEFPFKTINKVILPGSEKPTKSCTIIVVAAKGIGKSTICALKAIHCLFTIRRPVIIALAGTLDQLASSFLKELKELLKTSVLEKYVSISKEKICLKPFGKINDDEQCIISKAGYKKQKDQTSSNGSLEGSLRGIHTKTKSIVIVDEALLMTRGTYEDLIGIKFTGTSEFLFITNPPSYGDDIVIADIQKQHKDDPTYYSRHVSAYEVKRSTYNLEILLRECTTPQLITTNIMGQYYFDSRKLFFDNRSRIENFASKVPGDLQNFVLGKDVIIGVDIAHGIGKDFTCFVARKGSWFHILHYSQDMLIEESFDLILRYGAIGCHMAIDSCGIGNSVEPKIRFSGLNIKFTKINGGSKTNEDRYKDLNTLMLDSLRLVIEKEDSILTIASNCLKNKNDEFIIRRQILTESSYFSPEYEGTKLKAQYSKNKKSPDLLRAMSYTFPFGELTDNLLFKGHKVEIKGFKPYNVLVNSGISPSSNGFNRRRF